MILGPQSPSPRAHASPILALVMLAACSAPTVSPERASPSAVNSVPSATGSGASTAPSAPAATAELAVRLVQIGDVGWIYPVAQMTIMADGRVVTPPTEQDPAWSQRRLSPSGVERVIATVRGTGLFEASADYPMLHRPGAPEWPGMGGSQITVAVGHGAAQVVVSGGAWFGDEFEATYNVASPQRKALSDLAARLSDLSWLPDDAWLNDASQPYEPAAFLLITSWRLGDNPGQPSVDEIAWPFDVPLIEFGEELQQSSTEMLRCGVVDAGEAQTIVDALSGLPGSSTSGQELYASLRSPDAAVELWLKAMLPDGFPACDELLVGGV